jgi:hypothetical protein
MAIPIRIRSIGLIGTLVLPLWGGVTLAQSPPPQTQPTDPSAASSPHQRDVVKSPGAEAPAPADSASSNDSSTPHQKQVMKKKKHKAKPATDTTTSPPSAP